MASSIKILYFYFSFNLHEGIFEQNPFYVYKPVKNQTVYHNTIPPGMTKAKLSAIERSIQSREKKDQFYVIVDGNNRFAVWKEL